MFMKNKKYKDIFKKKVAMLATTASVMALMVIASLTPSFSYIDENGEWVYPTKEQIEQGNAIFDSMEAAGYSNYQILDEIDEKVYGLEGAFGTGGRDGLLLNGSPAPNAPGNAGGGGATGNTTTPVATPEPTCNHNYISEVTIEATCASEGKITYTCSLCGKSYSESIPKEEHNFTVKEEAKGTCVSVGYRIEECSGCGEQLTIEGLYGNHALVEHTDAKEPTCLEAGYKTDLCTICGVIITTDLPALDHEWETNPTIDVEPTCASEGSQSYHCTRCDETKDEAVVDALGHDIVVDEAPATLFGDGYYKEYCDRCDEVMEYTVYKSFVMENLVYIIVGAVVLVAGIVGTVVLIKKKKTK